MGDKSQNQTQIEKLIEIANQLEQRELALSREAKHLEEVKASLEEQERLLSAARAAKPEAAAEAAATRSALREKPVTAPESAPIPQFSQQPVRPSAPLPAPQKPAQQQKTTVEAVKEINEILQSIFWDYSSSVHQISSQLSTVTAAMMCAAVTCVLENRGFNAKEVFLQEMDKMLQGGGLGSASARPLDKPSHPAPAPKPSAAPVSPYKPDVAPDAPLKSLIQDAEAETSAAFAAPEAPAQPQPTEEGVVVIASAAEFQKLGEYGFRNDNMVVRVEIPEGVQYLPGSFFYGCGNLQEVRLPDSLLEIGPYAFYGCEQLHTVYLSEASMLTEIGEYAFAMCGAMQSFTVPDAVETLGTSVFRFCAQLEKLNFSKESKLRHIGSHLLQNCTALEKMRLPDGITTIPTSMFYGCSNIRKVIAKGVDTIEDYAFYGNENLRTIRIRTKKLISPQAFEGCDPALEIEYLNY
jgi:hypothetical protein